VLSREASSHSASHEIPRLLWVSKIYYCVQRNLINAAPSPGLHESGDILTPHSSKSLILASQLCLWIRSLCVSLLKFWMRLSSLWQVSSVLLDFITIILVSENYKLWSASLRAFLQLRVSSSPSVPNILLRILFSDTINLGSLRVSNQVSNPYKQNQYLRI
jgi:hypothetical protein